MAKFLVVWLSLENDLRKEYYIWYKYNLLNLYLYIKLNQFKYIFKLLKKYNRWHLIFWVISFDLLLLIMINLKF